MANFDKELEGQVVQWVTQVSGESKLPHESVAEWWQDGLVLCKLVNAIKPGTITKVSNMKAPFKKMENITRFTDAVRMFGTPESAMFATPDLYEEKNMGSVINCVYTFAGVIQTTVPEFKGPTLGPAIKATVQDKPRKKSNVTQTGGLAGTLEQTPAFTGKRQAASHAPGARR